MIESNSEIINLSCCRYIKNRFCNICTLLKEQWINNIPKYNNQKCIKCNDINYKPVF